MGGAAPAPPTSASPATSIGTSSAASTRARRSRTTLPRRVPPTLADDRSLVIPGRPCSGPCGEPLSPLARRQHLGGVERWVGCNLEGVQEQGQAVVMRDGDEQLDDLPRRR